ncbi:MAG: hypothetical protein Q4C37_08350 [Bacteroidales bacterium]|nr:hypothetical protein [Bacteroidales bacterium]
MKKLFLSLAATALCTTAFAGQRMLYVQNFDQASDAAATGWTYGGGSMTIASDEYGKFLELSLGQNNGRSGQVNWGTGIYQDAEGNSYLTDGKYSMSFEFSIKTMSNNQWNSEITVFTNHAARTNETYRTPWTAGYTGPWDNFVFDLSQCNTKDTDNTDMLATVNAPLVPTTGEDGTVTYAVATEPSYTFTTGAWYKVELEVDVNARTVDYNVESFTGDIVTTGTLNVPEKNVNAAEDEEPISMLAEGLFVMTARYQTTMDFDNIRVWVETTDDVANPPSVALTGLGNDGSDEPNLNYRAYTISFYDFETLHVKGTDGQTVDVEYADCDGAYVYETTTSGTLEAWTTSGVATSEVVSEKVDCAPVVLPAATATISSVAAGFTKTYTLNVSNSDVPLQPTIFINYVFTPKNGGTPIAEKELASGAQVTFEEEGTLELTTEAFGYQATTVKIENDLEFAVKRLYDFARLSEEDAKAAGFTTWQVLNSATTSGFSNWTARKRLYYVLEGSGVEDPETGEMVFTNVYPFGFVSEESTTEVMNYSEIGVDSKDAAVHDPGINVAGYELFPGIEVFSGHNVTYLQHIGMVNNSTENGNNKNIVVKDLDATDFVVVNKINDYGSSSIHPTCATTEEYYAQLCGTLNDVYSVAEVGTEITEGEGDAAVGTGKYSVTCPIYRIDTAATCVTVFECKGGQGSVEGVDAEVAGDNYYYTIDGLRLAQPTRPGLYIHNGKKIIVK